MVSATDYPRTWVAAQLDFGDAYAHAAPSSDTGDFDAFVKEAQSNLRTALGIYETTSAFVEQINDDVRWALVQDRIGNAHAMMYLFAKAPGLEAAPEERQHHYAAAIEAHSASLRVHTPERSPRKHLEMSVYLGRLHTYEGDWRAAEERFAAAARAADRLLGDVELSESDMKAVLRELGRTAMLAPFVALMLGQPERALELAETGRARLLAKALSLEALPLSAELRHQLHELQRQVAAHERRLVSPRLFDRRTPLNESMRLRK